MKTCIGCGLQKPISEFYAGKGKCKPCKYKAHRALPKIIHEVVQVGEKACIVCKEIQSVLNFSPNVATKDGRHGECRPCTRKRIKNRKRQKPVYLGNQLPEPDVEYITGVCVICDTTFNMSSSKHKRCVSCSEIVGHDIWPRLNSSHHRGIKRGEKASIPTVNEVARKYVAAIACVYCGGGFTEDNIKSLDHIVPYCKGGTNTSDNINICCHNCNQSKSSHMLDEWLDLCARVAAHTRKSGH